MEEGRTKIVELEGNNYFVVEQDLSKGDRRCDGHALASFFNVEAGSTTWESVRERHRLKKRREAAPPPTTENHERVSMDEVQENAHIFGDGRKYKKKARILRQKVKGDGNANRGRIVALRPPKAGIQCAGRNDTTRLLWLHEFYVVHEGTRLKGKNYIYQAVQFAIGEHVPADEVPNMTDRMRRSLWVQGRCHLPADHVRRFSKRNRGYIFHTELNDADARTALFAMCPEVVRVENWLQWHQMRCVSTQVPRVVHADDVQTRRVHVAGRENHFVCGVSAVQDVATQNFELSRLPRSGFCMYPEERLGMELNSPSMMWQHIDDIFHNLRGCMSSGRQGTTSGSFTMPLLCTVYDFWQVYRITIVLIVPEVNSNGVALVRS
jgi:hypothetical protein